LNPPSLLAGGDFEKASMLDVPIPKLSKEEWARDYVLSDREKVEICVYDAIPWNVVCSVCNEDRAKHTGDGMGLPDRDHKFTPKRREDAPFDITKTGDKTGERKHKTDFDPCVIWPARVPKKTVTAKPIDSTKGVGGAYNQSTKTAHLPMANNYYARTIRLHESLHAIYTKRKPGKDGYTNLEQGLEDARLHLNHAKTTGRVRRDEIATALRDLRRIPPDHDLAAILALRSAAILERGFANAHEVYPDRPRTEVQMMKRSAKALLRMADSVQIGYREAISLALRQLRDEKWDDAKTTLEPFFNNSKPVEKSWPSIGMGEPEEGPVKEYADVSFAKLEGKLTSEAAEMLNKETAKMVGSNRMPTLNIHQIFANANVPTFFGETEKHTLSGCKIDPKKLALVVGPAMPRLFTKTIHRNGGTIVIDASGSMALSENQLLSLLVSAPLATIGFYNAHNDVEWQGNLWIFAHKGKRAIDLRDVKMHAKRGPSGKYVTDAVFGTGNVVDFQVLQWLLAQSAPRYILTDGKFVGPSYASNDAAKQLLYAAIARKKLTQITSFKEMAAVLAKKGVTV
jgi:hypothetical protein